MAAVTAALRALAQVGNPADDVAAGLITAGQADGCGHVRPRRHRTGRVERAWTWKPSCASSRP